jgi:hypothetical protein
MLERRTLRMSEICDESRHIRPVYIPRDRAAWIPDGQFDGIDDEGRVRVSITYRNGIVHGPYTGYWSNGNAASVGQFENGVQHGEWKYVNVDGTVAETVLFAHGKEVIAPSTRSEGVPGTHP